MKYLLMASAILIFSCSVQKRHYTRGFYVSHSSPKTPIGKKAAKTKVKEEIKQQEEARVTTRVNKDQQETSDAPMLASVDPNQVALYQHKPNYFNKDTCGDIITLRKGDELLVKVIEVTPTEIKYKKCDNIDGPLYIAKKSEVFSIKYTNGNKEIMPAVAPSQEEGKPRSDQNAPKKVNGAAVTGFIISVLSLFVPIEGAILVALIGIVFAAVGLNKISKNPDRLKGKGWATAGIIIGAIAVLLAIIILGSM